MFISYNKNLIVNILSDTPIETDQKIKKVSEQHITVGKRMPSAIISKEDYTKKEIKDLRVALVCNWNDNCGIATYSRYLCDAIIPQVKTLKIFSEVNDALDLPGYDVEKCWERGKCLLSLIKKIKEYSPDFVIIQHEFGIFPNAFYFSQLCQNLNEIPYVVSTHSVYKHLDKIVYSEAAKNIVVHTENQKTVYKEMGNTSNIFVIPHGCVSYADTSELWNINQNDYTIIQYGFGFRYKGIPRILNAIKYLKDTDPKFKNIFYTYLMSENSHNKSINQTYYDEIMKIVTDLGIEENVAVIRKYQTEQMLCLQLRLNKIAVFPYINSEENSVYSASGAARISMANKRPTIVSESHLFDDMEGILPKPKDHIELAKEIDKIFSDSEYKQSIINNGFKYTQDNSWDKCATKYLEIYNKLVTIS